MIRLEKVNANNVWELLKLQVLEEQRYFVADNDTSIIEAYTTITANGYTFPFGEAEYCWLSYEPENKVAADLYHSFGFEETGDEDDGELIAVLKL